MSGILFSPGAPGEGGGGTTESHCPQGAVGADGTLQGGKVPEQKLPMHIWELKMSP